MNEVSARRQQTRLRLLSAAAALFAEKGVQAASVEEICDRAGFTRGAFYSNFDTKDELCLALVRYWGDLLLETTRKALSEIPQTQITEHTFGDVIGKILAVVDVVLNVDDEWVLVRMELRLYAHRNPAVRQALLDAEQGTAALAIEAIVAAVQRQQATLRLPVSQLLTVMDSYCERLRIDEILLDHRAGEVSSWRPGLEGLLRALVVLPPDQVE